MWKKTEGDETMQDSPTDRPMLNTQAAGTTGGAGKSATIGPSISINGDVTGEEDLVIYGSVEGTVNLKSNNLVVGDKGELTANVSARVIRVEGAVKGELIASERIVITPNGSVTGDITAPRVVLEDGCNFKGSIDMDSSKKPAKAAPAQSAEAQSRPAASNGGGAKPQQPASNPNIRPVAS